MAPSSSRLQVFPFSPGLDAAVGRARPQGWSHLGSVWWPCFQSQMFPKPNKHFSLGEQQNKAQLAVLRCFKWKRKSWFVGVNKWLGEAFRPLLYTEVKSSCEHKPRSKGDLSIKICLSTSSLCSCRKVSLSVSPHQTTLCLPLLLSAAAVCLRLSKGCCRRPKPPAWGLCQRASRPQRKGIERCPWLGFPSVSGAGASLDKGSVVLGLPGGTPGGGGGSACASSPG